MAWIGTPVKIWNGDSSDSIQLTIYISSVFRYDLFIRRSQYKIISVLKNRLVKILSDTTHAFRFI